jgi:hypothetical protein
MFYYQYHCEQLTYKTVFYKCIRLKDKKLKFDHFQLNFLNLCPCLKYCDIFYNWNVQIGSVLSTPGALYPMPLTIGTTCPDPTAKSASLAEHSTPTLSQPEAPPWF